MIVAATLSASSANAAPRQCRTRDLVVDQVRFGSSGTFHDYLDMALVNVSPSSCSVVGWPHIQMLDAHVRPIRIHTSRSHPAPARVVTLGSWQRAYFTIHFTGGGPCLPQHRAAQGVRVTPPGGSGGLVAAARVDMCALHLPIPIGIDPLRANRGVLPPLF